MQSCFLPCKLSPSRDRHRSGRSKAGGGASGRCSRSAVCADSRRCSSWSVRLHSWKARPWKRGKSYSCYFILLYSSSLTASCHSLDVFSPGISKARWANQLSFAAPCQCFTLAGMWMTVPGRISCAGFPSS